MSTTTASIFAASPRFDAAPHLSPSRQCIGSQLVEALASLTIELHNQAITDTIGMCAERCAHKHA
jgi:hypothetical protein